MNERTCMAVVMLALSVAAGCGREGVDPPARSREASPASKSFRLKGVVRKVDASSGEVSIAHQEIPGFMPKMTMPFALKDKALLKELRPGDEVEGTLGVDYEGEGVKGMDLLDLTVTRRAVAGPPGSSLTPAPGAGPLKPGEPVPDFAVTTQDGSTLRLSDLRGKVIALTFIYTRCPLPEFCPAMDAKFAELARRISAVPARADGVRLLSVSFDPEHDTPAVLSAHAARRGAKPPLWTFAVASHEELGKVADAFGLTYIAGTREIEHNLRAALIGPDGRLVRLEVGPGWAPTDLIKAIYGLTPPRQSSERSP